MLFAHFMALAFLSASSSLASSTSAFPFLTFSMESWKVAGPYFGSPSCKSMSTQRQVMSAKTAFSNIPRNKEAVMKVIRPLSATAPQMLWRPSATPVASFMMKTRVKLLTATRVTLPSKMKTLAI